MTRDNEATERIAEAWEPNRGEESTEHVKHITIANNINTVIVQGMYPTTSCPPTRKHLCTAGGGRHARWCPTMRGYAVRRECATSQPNA